jgi:hypothetical protein
MSNTHSIYSDRDATTSQGGLITDESQTGLDLSGNFTMEAWGKRTVDTVSGYIYLIVSKYLATGNQRGYWLVYRNISGVERISVNLSPNGTNIYRVDWSNTLTKDTWTHLAVTCTIANSNSTKLTLYVNGSSEGNGTLTTDPGSFSEIYNTTASFGLGIGADNGSGWGGNIDDVRVWNVVRTSTEIENNYQTQLAGNESGLVGYWKLNNNYNDSTSNANHLTAYNSPTFSNDVPSWTASTVVKDMLGGIIPFAR